MKRQIKNKSVCFFLFVCEWFGLIKLASSQSGSENQFSVVCNQALRLAAFSYTYVEVNFKKKECKANQFINQIINY